MYTVVCFFFYYYFLLILASILLASLSYQDQTIVGIVFCEIVLWVRLTLRGAAQCFLNIVTKPTWGASQIFYSQ